MIQTTTYTINAHLEHPVRIAFVSDLHDRCPDEVLALLKEQKPDLLLIGGDLMERYDPSKSEWSLEEMNHWQGISKKSTMLHNFVKMLDGSLPGQAASEKPKKWDEQNGRRFLKETSAEMPVALSVGNHEWYYLDDDREIIATYGIHHLDNTDVELQICGNTFLIGGLSTRYDRAWLEAFSQKEGHKILLSHHPEYVVRYVGKRLYPCFDLILSGHAHGGQWRFPIPGKKGVKQSVFAPGQGVFPKYAYGRFGHWIIGAGVSNTSSIPRFGNPCELVMINLN